MHDSYKWDGDSEFLLAADYYSLQMALYNCAPVQLWACITVRLCNCAPV